jgi:hypothetical protein
MEAGRCYWVIGAGQQGMVKRLDVSVWNARKERVAQHRGDNSLAVVPFCPCTAGTYKLDARTKGRGPYELGVYVK